MNTACIALLLLSGWAASARAAATPQRIDFQGKLLNASNNPRNGTVLLNFRLYDVPTGGTSLWSEQHPTVTVSNGVFAVQLGSYTALTPGLFAGASAYVEIDVDPAGAEPLETLSPRHQLLMSPYAFTAARLTDTGDVPIQAGLAYSTFTAAGDLNLAPGGDLTLSGAAGYVNTGSSVNASAFFGNGSGLTGLPQAVFGAALNYTAGNAGTFHLAGYANTSEGAPVLAENLRSFPIGAGAIKNLRVFSTLAPGPTGPNTFVVRVLKNNVATAVTCTMTDPATTCTDLTNSEAFAAGDRFVFQVEGTGASIANTGVRMSVEFHK